MSIRRTKCRVAAAAVGGLDRPVACDTELQGVVRQVLLQGHRAPWSSGQAQRCD
ncbi:hypothetical protein [Streptomyces sp. NPDC000880]